MEKVLLIGNDINNVTATYSWDNLLNDLITFAHLQLIPDKSNKPFPMLYEEIYLRSARQHGTKEIKLKEFIASNTHKLEPNDIHHRIIGLDVQDILTSNYDLTFEKCIDPSSNNFTNQGYIRETRYSLFRMHQLENKKVWHIHGSEVSPRSVILGYEHYSGYLQQMRNFVASGTKGTYAKKDFKPIKQRMADGPLEHYSWVEFFFTCDVHILGLNLDFVEIHLWWLLIYRARAIAEKRFPIQNSLFYYLPEQYRKNSKHKLDLFEINGVKTISIPMKRANKKDYYNKVLDHIERMN